MKKISLLPLFFSLSLSVAYGAQMQGANEQDKSKENIESKNNKEPSIPSLKRDIRQHWGYYIAAFINESMNMRHFLNDTIKDIGSPTELNTHFCKFLFKMIIRHNITLFLEAVCIALIEETGKVDDNPNPLSYKNRLFRILKFTLLLGILNAFISSYGVLYHNSKGELKSSWNSIVYYYLLLLKAVCLVPYLLITPTLENAQRQEANEQDKATVDEVQ